MSGIEYKKGRITGTVKILPPPPAKTLPSRAEIQLSKMPGIPINYTSVQTYRNVPQASMQNYALQIQLGKISDASMMKPSELNYKKAFQADGTTPQMLEAYKQLERADLYKQGIFRPNYDINLINIPDEETAKNIVQREIDETNAEADNDKRIIQRDYNKVKTNYDIILVQKARLRAAYNKLTKAERDVSPFNDEMEALNIELERLRNEINSFNAQIGTVETTRRENLDNINKNLSSYYEAKKANEATFRRYENDIRSLNQGFQVGRMVGETDDEYKNRLLTFERENIQAITQQEAAMYNNMVFKNNLRKVVRLPVHLEEELLKKLGQAYLFDINERWPLYEKKFIETYGKFPVLGERNSLVNFFTKVIPPSVEQKTAFEFFKSQPIRKPFITEVSTSRFAEAPSRSAEAPSLSAEAPRKRTLEALTNRELVDIIREKGGKANMSMSKKELLSSVSNFYN
jgi:hypothetical protein